MQELRKHEINPNLVIPIISLFLISSVRDQYFSELVDDEDKS